MEWFGIVALLLLLCYSAYPGKVKRLETKVKRLEKKQRGVKSMDYNLQKNQNAEQTYHSIRNSIVSAWDCTLCR